MDALRTLGAALIIGLGFVSGAFAQSGNPIRVGMSLALTGAGAAPSKVINTALEIWRDDVNAKQRYARDFERGARNIAGLDVHIDGFGLAGHCLTPCFFFRRG
jgi:hypothetical protein